MGREREIARWIAREILPHERSVRSRLARRWASAVDMDDVIQEAYCRIARLDNVEKIDNPAGYFHRAAHTVAIDMIRRQGVLNVLRLNETDWIDVKDNEPLADRVLEGREELARANAILAEMPDSCRRAIEMRRLEGLSQRETAEKLGVSESIVRNHLVRGIQKVLKKMTDQDEVQTAKTLKSEMEKVEYIGAFRSR